MSERMKRYGKIMGSVLFALIIITLVGWRLALAYYQPTVTPAVQEAVVTATLATITDVDGDGLDDDWEDDLGFTVGTSTGDNDNTGDVFTSVKYVEDTNGYRTGKIEQTFVVEAGSSSEIQNSGTAITGLKLVSEVRYDYDQSGRVWRTRQVATLDNGSGQSVTGSGDKITLTVYNDDGSVFKTVAKGVGETDDDAIEDDDIVATHYYDDLGRVETTIDAAGHGTYYVYTSLGQREQVYRELFTTSSGNDSGIDTTVSTTLEVSTANGFASSHPLIGKTLLLVSEIDYDDAGRVEKTLDAKGNYRTMDYDSRGQVIEAIAWDEEGTTDTTMLQTLTAYDNLGRTARQVVMETVDQTLTNAYDVDVDEDVDKVTDYVYDSEVRDSVTVSYPGKLMSVTTYNNNSTTALTTTYDYDAMGRQEVIAAADGSETHVVYNDAGRVARRWTKETNTTLSQTVYTVVDMDYGQSGQVVAQRQVPMDPSNPTTVGTDAYKLENGTYPMIGETGYPSESTDGATGYFATSFVYNGLGQVETMIDPEGTETTYSYNWLGQKDETIEDAGTGGIARKTEFDFDRLGRQSSISGYADGSTEQQTVYAYNALGQVTSITYPGHTSTHREMIEYTYNPMGQVTQRTDQRSVVTEYEYDAGGNLLTKAVDDLDYDFESDTDDKIIETFTYDALGRMLTAAKNVYYDGSTTATHISTSTLSSYTSLGAAESINDMYFTDTTGKSSTYDHDQAGNLTSTTYPDGSTVVERTIDPRGRIDTISKGTSSTQTDIVSYAYVGSRVGQRIYDDTDASGSNDVTYTIDYDDYGRADRHYTYQNTTDIVDFGYSYDNNSNIVEISLDHRPSTPDNSFTYDDLNRLTGAEYLSDTSDTESFTMDDLGNRTSATLRGDTSATSYAVNDLTNRYDGTGTFDVTLGYDNAGNTTDHGAYDYFYDYENRLIRIEDSSTLIASFEYDALGRRIRRAVEETFARDYYCTDYYYNAQWQVLYQEDGDYPEQMFVYGNYIDEVLCMDNSTDHWYYAHNHLFSTAALLDEDGTVVERYEYDAYGEVTVYTNDGADDAWLTSDDTTQHYSWQGNPYTFTGRCLDVYDAGDLLLMDYRHRTYNPQLGRFLQQDPIDYVDGMSLYEYVMSNSINRVDPSGFGLVIVGSDDLVENTFIPGFNDPAGKKARCKEKLDKALKNFDHMFKGWENPKYRNHMIASLRETISGKETGANHADEVNGYCNSIRNILGDVECMMLLDTKDLYKYNSLSQRFNRNSLVGRNSPLNPSGTNSLSPHDICNEVRKYIQEQEKQREQEENCDSTNSSSRLQFLDLQGNSYDVNGNLINSGEPCSTYQGGGVPIDIGTASKPVQPVIPRPGGGTSVPRPNIQFCPGGGNSVPLRPTGTCGGGGWGGAGGAGGCGSLLHEKPGMYIVN